MLGILILVPALAVSAFGINTVSDLMHTYFAEVPSETPGVMNMPFWGTTLILAGGCKGIYNLLRKLGYREEMPDATQPSNHG